jgi:hypothetical protein
VGTSKGRGSNGKIPLRTCLGLFANNSAIDKQFVTGESGDINWFKAITLA